MNAITPLQPSPAQAEMRARADIDPMQDGAMLRKVKDDSSVATSDAVEKSEPPRNGGANLGNSIDTYA